ncbi:MAG: retropepsin-like domain-containing protein [Candidatus Azobacteroides sp.]|nr:retropepsin-like domain-containing protein [Candidatus Azobacteroides sp.]
MTEKRLLKIIENKDYFRLEILLKEKRSELSKDIALYVDANLQNAFNRTGQSLQLIDVLLSHYSKSLNDTLLLKTYQLKCDNLVKQSMYKEATEALEIAIDKYGHASDSTDMANMRDFFNVIEPLKELSPQKMDLTNDITIPISRNQSNNVMIQVMSNGQPENFIFDTGAMFSVVSESCAKRMGIRILESGVNVGNSIGSKVQSKMGIADSLHIGKLLVENVPFLVIPDEMLSFPQDNFFIHGILGFPVMYQMKEITIQKDECLVVSAHPKKRDLHNLFLDGLSPIVQFEAEGDTVLFKIDTGADSSEFSEKYFVANKDKIIKNATSKSKKMGGAGGVIDSKVYELENVRLKICGQELTIPTIPVLTDKLSFIEDYDGNLGQDVLMHFNKLILNFDDMYLAFEN